MKKLKQARQRVEALVQATQKARPDWPADVQLAEGLLRDCDWDVARARDRLLLLLSEDGTGFAQEERQLQTDFAQLDPGVVRDVLRACAFDSFAARALLLDMQRDEHSDMQALRDAFPLLEEDLLRNALLVCGGDTAEAVSAIRGTLRTDSEDAERLFLSMFEDILPERAVQGIWSMFVLAERQVDLHGAINAAVLAVCSDACDDCPLSLLLSREELAVLRLQTLCESSGIARSKEELTGVLRRADWSVDAAFDRLMAALISLLEPGEECRRAEEPFRTVSYAGKARKAVAGVDASAATAKSKPYARPSNGPTSGPTSGPRVVDSPSSSPPRPSCEPTASAELERECRDRALRAYEAMRAEFRMAAVLHGTVRRGEASEAARRGHAQHAVMRRENMRAVLAALR